MTTSSPEHPHPLHILARFEAVPRNAGVEGAITPYDPEALSGPEAFWTDPASGVTCTVWVEHEPWRATPELDPEAHALWKKSGEDWWWDHRNKDRDTNGVAMSGEGAIDAAREAAWWKVGWVPEFGPLDQPTKAMAVAYLSSRGQSQRDLGFRMLAFVEAEGVAAEGSEES